MERSTPVINLTVPGWMPATSNLSKLTEEIERIDPGPDCILISDLISNVSFGFEQLNGSLALPIKSGGTYHLFGKVTTCNKESLHTVLEKVLPIFKSVPGLKYACPHSHAICTTPAVTLLGTVMKWAMTTMLQSCLVKLFVCEKFCAIFCMQELVTSWCLTQLES